MAAAEGIARFEEKLGEPGIDLDNGHMRWAHGKNAPLEQRSPDGPNLWRLRARIARARLVVDALGSDRDAAGAVDSAPQSGGGADPYLSLCTYLEQLETEWNRLFRATLLDVARVHLRKATKSRRLTEQQVELLTSKCDDWLEKNYREPTATAGIPLAEGAVDLAWAADQVDAMLDGPPLVTQATWRGLNLEAEFGGRAVANTARSVLLARAGGSQQASYNSIESAKENTAQAFHRGGMARQAEDAARALHTEAYMQTYRSLDPPPPAPEPPAPAPAPVLVPAPAAEAEGPARRTAELPPARPAPTSGMEEFKQPLGQPGVTLARGPMDWSHRYHAPLERPSPGEQWLMRERIAVARLLVEGMAGDAEGSGSRVYGGRTVRGADPELSMRAYLAHLESDWERHFGDALVRVVSIQMDRAPELATPEEHAQLIADKRDEWLQKNRLVRSSSQAPTPATEAVVDPSWAAEQVDALITRPHLVTETEWHNWNMRAEFAGRAVLAETRIVRLMAKDRSPENSRRAAERNTTAAHDYGKLVEEQEARNRARNSSAYMRRFLDRNPPDRSTRVRATAPVATLTQDQQRQLLNHVGATARGFGNVARIDKGLDKAQTGLVLASSLRAHVAEATAITRRLTESRREGGLEIRRELG